MKAMYSKRGGTLTELMVATVILSIGILGLFGSFKFIARSTLVSRATSMATNLGQERIESLKNLSYYSLQITTATNTNSTVTPAIVYDTVNYPPEQISIGGITFTRYTFVGMAEMTGTNISTVAFTYPDTGLKQITVDIVWSEAGRAKRWTLRNLLENPNINPLDATVSGTVTNSAGGVVASAVVVVEQNEDWGATTNAAGAYSFSVYHGTYTIRASSAGYSSGVSSSFVAAKGATPTTVPAIPLTAIATGTVSGEAWINSNIVISQVMADTQTIVSDGSEQHVEYFELFNPTTFSITIGTKAAGSPNMYFYTVDQDWNYQCQGCDSAPTVTRSYITHVSSYVGPGRYYLLANASSFFLNGGWVRPDAYFTNAGGVQTYPDLLKTAGAIAVLDTNLWNWTDIVGWSRSGIWAPWSNGWPVPNTAGSDGLQAGLQIVRVSSPGISAATLRNYGSAYNTLSNDRDFNYSGGTYFTGLLYPPRTTASGAFTTITGKPPSMLGTTYVSAGDPNSGSTAAWTSYVTSGTLSLPYTRFQLSGVTTGTWSVAALYDTYANFWDNVVVSQNQHTGVPNSATSPAWPGAGLTHAQLSSSTIMGFIKGVVQTAALVPINGITVQGGGVSKVTGSNGVFFMPVSSGTITVIANPNNANANYVESIASVLVTAGNVTTQNFTLLQGGRISGYVTTGTTPLANQAIAATSGGSQAGSAVTDASGVFTMRNMPAGNYTVFPVMESGQDATPDSLPATVVANTTVFCGTFTVSGAFGTIAGTVRDASGLVTSGALILASTNTLASTPAAIVASSAPSQVPLYMVSSKADGTYTLPVRGGSTYNVSAYVPVISGAGVSITTKTYSGIAVSASVTTNRDVTIP